MTIGAVCRIVVKNLGALDDAVIHGVPMAAWYERLKVNNPELWRRMMKCLEV